MEPENISTKLGRIAEQARRLPELAFTSLNQYLDLDLLREAFRRINRRASPGVDGVTIEEYETGLEDRLKDLLERAKSGTYRAPPVKRVHIPKGSGPETRPIGIPTLEDRILQQAVRMILEEVYEQDFYPCSYGFRRKKSAHDALEDLWKSIPRRGCWLLDVDIRKFFDTLDHGKLKELLNLRVRDGVIRRLLHKWLHAGVLEDGGLSYPDSGTPQGGVISPLLANIYLHEVLDKWFHQVVKPRMRGRAFLIRYADDFVMGFECEADARKVLDVLPKRFGKYGLSLHPDKTRMVDFRRRENKPKGPRAPDALPTTFDFLSFTHHWGLSKKGNLTVMRKTSSKRFSRLVATLTEWCRVNRHLPVKVQAAALGRKLNGLDQYFGITGNYRALARLRHVLERAWRKWLDRRSQKRAMPWPRFKRLLQRYPLPRPRVWHSALRPRQQQLPFVT
jgi:group II intron reverse transcriptase/maturase